jgi:hypothetical protein
MAHTEGAATSRREKRMLGLGLDAWNNIMIASLAFGALAAVIVGLSTYVVIRLQKTEAQASAAEFDRYKLATEKSISDARARAAIAEKQAAEANLELARLKTPRSLSPEQHNGIVERLRQFAGTQFDTALVPGDPESAKFLVTIEEVLLQAGWKQIDWEGGDIVFNRDGKPVAGMTSANNVIVAIFPEQIQTLEPAALSLVAALKSAGILADLQNATGITNTNRDALHILMGHKT